MTTHIQFNIYKRGLPSKFITDMAEIMALNNSQEKEYSIANLDNYLCGFCEGNGQISCNYLGTGIWLVYAANNPEECLAQITVKELYELAGDDLDTQEWVDTRAIGESAINEANRIISKSWE